jgi:NDP-sugar pyrophosphorylase family protein
MPERSTALVIAGGEGRRMARTRPEVPKPLLELGGRPLVEIIIRQLLAADIPLVHVALRYRAAEIIERLRQSPRIDGRRLRFLVEDEPRGTIGSLAELRSLGLTVLAANGDLLSGIDLRALFRFHRREGAAMTIPTHVERLRLRLGEVLAGPDSRVTGYLEKPLKEFRISSGIYLMEPPVLSLIAPGERLQLPDLVQRALAAGLTILEYPHREPWLDINDEDDLAAAREMLAGDPAAFGLADIRTAGGGDPHPDRRGRDGL